MQQCAYADKAYIGALRELLNDDFEGLRIRYARDESRAVPIARERINYYEIYIVNEN